MLNLLPMLQIMCLALKVFERKKYSIDDDVEMDFLSFFRRRRRRPNRCHHHSYMSGYDDRHIFYE
ncbi:hypothetical protein DERP_007000 [Dermatophagoides pteronyssinus]|uniref:Uncharacterized protein n=1 Tax=Dermatophagoides pteronyssinus TaxID=6956 RepID=A0ABQ8JUB8_DERPT|nr:hypothetical protein DERP_007000 [Dermatophagoides pteronyssinus]